MGLIRSLLTRFGLADFSHQRDPIDVFILDDDTRRHRYFRKSFKGDLLEITETVDEAIEVLGSGSFDAIFLDHDLLPHHYDSNDHDDHESTGYAVAEWLTANRELHRSTLIIVHTRNPEGGMKMVEKLRESGRQVEYVPFPLLEGKIRQYWGK